MTALTTMMLGTRGGPINVLGVASANSSGNNVVAGISVLQNGTITYNTTGGDSSGPTAWFNPTGGTPGSSYWLKITPTAGTLTVNAASSPTQLNATRTFSVTSPGPGIKNCSGNIEIFSDAGGTVLVASGTFDLITN